MREPRNKPSDEPSDAPLPWKTHWPEMWDGYILDANGKCILAGEDISNDEYGDKLGYIVHCANHYPEMVDFIRSVFCSDSVYSEWAYELLKKLEEFEPEE